jgi:hypothetical protein
MTTETSVAISIGFATRSVSLQGFGIDSIIELIAGLTQRYNTAKTVTEWKRVIAILKGDPG